MTHWIWHLIHFRYQRTLIDYLRSPYLDGFTICICLLVVGSFGLFSVFSSSRFSYCIKCILFQISASRLSFSIVDLSLWSWTCHLAFGCRPRALACLSLLYTFGKIRIYKWNNAAFAGKIRILCSNLDCSTASTLRLAFLGLFDQFWPIAYSWFFSIYSFSSSRNGCGSSVNCFTRPNFVPEKLRLNHAADTISKGCCPCPFGFHTHYSGSTGLHLSQISWNQMLHGGFGLMLRFNGFAKDQYGLLLGCLIFGNLLRSLRSALIADLTSPIGGHSKHWICFRCWSAMAFDLRVAEIG